jgi:hypothetical protein
LEDFGPRGGDEREGGEQRQKGVDLMG